MQRSIGGIAAISITFGAASPALADNPATALEAPKVEVVGTTPLPALGLPKSKVPANVQILNSESIETQSANDVTQFLDDNASSINLNSAQANPFQPDVNFRGFTASHLLGLPQGLSVFQDGVRVNESFGDTVNWDLIPQSAISSITVMPGSNPQFGLNTLGGSLAITTKSGFQYPGFSASVTGGSFGRKSGSFEWGGHGEKLDYFLTGNYLDEDGWRDYSPSRLQNLFGKVGYQDGLTDFDLSFTGAHNKLEGTQALPASFLGNRAQAYTWPDRTKNDLAMINARLSHFMSDTLLFSGDLYYRHRKTDSFASNTNGDCADSTTPFACVIGTPPATEPQGANDAIDLKQNSYGAAAQLSYLGALLGKENQLAVGLSADLGRSDFKQYEQAVNIDATRGTNILLEPLQPLTFARGTNRYLGVYVTDTLSLTESIALTASGRFNRAKVKIEDTLGNKPELAGNHTFTRFNPAIGITYSPIPTYTTYANYSEGMRAPTPVELTCANENAPCPLPNAFLDDPPLKPVISRTYEVGTRASVSNFGLSLAVFRTDLRDDIQFVSSQSTTLGYFANVGNTRRQGVELSANTHVGRLALSASYTYLNATFETPFILNSPNNSSAADLNGDGNATEIQVSPGNRIPNIPENTLKLRADYRVTDELSVGSNVVYNSGVYLRGDENNQDVHGRTAAYTLVNLDARYRVTREWLVFLRVNNVFNRPYENFGVLGENLFPGGVYDPTSAITEPFYGVGAPRAAWIGVRYQIGRSGGSADRD
ncbi:MAG: TonB-dependent receptor [Betaproteobacteria bacterium]|nr:TonB-dependent receptor [Betaproteobacteria bacterium]